MWRHLKEALNDFRHALRPSGSTKGAAPGEQPGVETPEVTPATTSASPAALPAAEAQADSDAAAQSAPEPGSVGPPAAAPARAGRSRWIRPLAIAGLIVLGLVVLEWAPWSAREPADPTVVATYQGGVLTREQLRQQFEALPKEERPVFRTPDGLKALVVDAVVHQVTRRWAEEKQLGFMSSTLSRRSSMASRSARTTSPSSSSGSTATQRSSPTSSTSAARPSWR